MKISLSLVDKKNEKSTLDITGTEDEVDKQLDGIREWADKRGLTVTDYTCFLSDGSVGSMAHGANCLDCGRPAATQFDKVERAGGVAIARTEVPLCRHHFKRFLKDKQYREKMWTIGLQLHLAAE